MTEAKSETVNIDNLDTFVKVLVAWHNDKLKKLEHMLEMPKGFSMQVDEGEAVEMTDDMLVGFKAGISVALMELGTLPFAYELEDAPQPEVAATAASNGSAPA